MIGRANKHTYHHLRQTRSSKESHVGPPDTIVGVASSAEQPLSNRALSSVRAEEVVEDGSVERAHCALSEIVVVGFNLRATVVVRIFNEDLDHVCILCAELSQSLLAAVELVILHGGDEAIELLLLIPLATLLNYDRASQMLQEVSPEDLHGL